MTPIEDRQFKLRLSSAAHMVAELVAIFGDPGMMNYAVNQIVVLQDGTFRRVRISVENWDRPVTWENDVGSGS